MPRPKRTAPRPHPSPKSARMARSRGGDAAYTAKMLGTNRSVMIQLNTIMPSSENVAHVCSHDHLRTSVMGRMKVPCSKPASSTRRKPRSKGIGVIVAGLGRRQTNLEAPFRAAYRIDGLHRGWAMQESHL